MKTSYENRIKNLEQELSVYKEVGEVRSSGPPITPMKTGPNLFTGSRTAWKTPATTKHYPMLDCAPTPRKTPSLLQVCWGKIVILVQVPKTP